MPTSVAGVMSTADKARIYDIIQETVANEQWAECLRGPLVQAGSTGDVGLTTKLLLPGASPDAKFQDHEPVLYRAAKAGDERAVRVRLGHCA